MKNNPLVLLILIGSFAGIISETTFGGRRELYSRSAGLDGFDDTGPSAREAIKIMAELVDEYGYHSSGGSFSIADTKEAWIVEMISPGRGGKESP